MLVIYFNGIYKYFLSPDTKLGMLTCFKGEELRIYTLLVKRFVVGKEGIMGSTCVLHCKA